MSEYQNKNRMAPQCHPNMIWVFADQLRAHALGCNGDPNVHTPNLDMLSQTGIQVEGGVSGMPLCCPFRGSLLSGRYPHHAVPGHEIQLPPEMPTVADAFGETAIAAGRKGRRKSLSPVWTAMRPIG